MNILRIIAPLHIVILPREIWFNCQRTTGVYNILQENDKFLNSKVHKFDNEFTELCGYEHANL